MKPFKSKLKVKYCSELGMWVIHGESLTRRCVDGQPFYDKEQAINFKANIDERDYYFDRNQNLKKNA